MYDIALISDEHYIVPTLVTLRSIKINRISGQKYRVFVITNCDDKVIKDKIETEACEQFEVHVRKYDSHLIEIDANHLYVSKAALIKFCLGEIFSELNSILYLDGDILVRPGMEQIFSYHIENVYAAVVKDMNVGISQHSKDLGIENYFNSGVMFLNLKRMREDKLKEKLFAYKMSEEKHTFMDQDCFNVCFKNQVLYMPLKFNFIYDIVGKYTNEQILEYYDEQGQNINNLEKEAIVFHMAGTVKPWKEINSIVFREWLSYIKDFLEFSFCMENFSKKNKEIEDRGRRNETAIGFINEDIKRVQDDYNERCDFLTGQLGNLRKEFENLRKEFENLQKEFETERNKHFSIKQNFFRKGKTSNKKAIKEEE